MTSPTKPPDAADTTSSDDPDADDVQPTTVQAVNPSRTTITSGTRVLITQDNEENWVIIWAECQ